MTDTSNLSIDPMAVIQRLSEKLATREQELAIAELIIEQLQEQAAAAADAPSV